MAERGARQTRAEISLAGLTVVWGSTFIIVKDALGDSSTILFLALRFSLAAVTLLLLFRGGERQGSQWPRELRAGALAGLFLFGGYLFQTWGLLYTTPAKSGFLTGLNVVFVPLLGACAYRKLPQASEWIGIAVATAGMAMLTLDGPAANINRGDFLTLLCALAFAVHLLILSRYSPSMNYRNLSIVQIGTAALLALGSFWWAEPVRLHWTPRLAIAIGITSLLGTAFAFVVMTWAQRHTSPTRAAVLFSLEPVVALATSYIVAGEVLRQQAAWGAVLILAGILIVELKPIRFS